MAPQSKIQNADEVIRWIKEGRSYAWMTAEHERKYNIRISPSGWSYFRGKQGLDVRAVSDEELVPWSVKHEHRNNYYLYCLRQEARRRRGKKLDPRAEIRVDAFLRDLTERRVVVDYDPSTQNGFILVDRETQDEGDLVRRPSKEAVRRRRGS